MTKATFDVNTGRIVVQVLHTNAQRRREAKAAAKAARAGNALLRAAQQPHTGDQPNRRTRRAYGLR